MTASFHPPAAITSGRGKGFRSVGRLRVVPDSRVFITDDWPVAVLDAIVKMAALPRALLR